MEVCSICGTKKVKYKLRRGTQLVCPRWLFHTEFQNDLMRRHPDEKDAKRVEGVEGE